VDGGIDIPEKSHDTSKDLRIKSSTVRHTACFMSITSTHLTIEILNMYREGKSILDIERIKLNNFSIQYIPRDHESWRY